MTWHLFFSSLINYTFKNSFFGMHQLDSNDTFVCLFGGMSFVLHSSPRSGLDILYNISLIIIIIKQLAGLTHYWILCGLSININNYLKSWTWTKMKWIPHSFPWSLWERSWHVVQPSVWYVIIVWQCWKFVLWYQCVQLDNFVFVYVYFPLLNE